MKNKKGKVGAGTLALVGAVGVGLWLWLKGKPAPPEPGKANLYGKVTNAETGSSVAGVTVTVDGFSGTTGLNGNYSITNLEPGSYSGVASKSGYEPFYF